MIERIRFGERTRELYRQLGQYGVGIYEKQFEYLRSRGELEVIDDDSAVLKNINIYSGLKGLIVEEGTTALFI